MTKAPLIPGARVHHPALGDGTLRELDGPAHAIVDFDHGQGTWTVPLHRLTPKPAPQAGPQPQEAA